MWETIFNVGMVVVGMGVLMFVSWAVDKQDKMFEDLDYNDED
jgi:hypothetical membrane protein